jgi:hypothetical protein
VCSGDLCGLEVLAAWLSFGIGLAPLVSRIT